MKMTSCLTAALFCLMVSCSNPAEDDGDPFGYHIDQMPSWSETWDLIAYYHVNLDLEGPDSAGLYVIKPDGTEKRMIYQVLIISCIDWSSSGQWIFINTGNQIIRISFPKGQADTLTAPGEYWDFSVSPDNQNLVFSNRSGDQMGVYFMNIGTGITRKITGDGDGATMPFSDSIMFLAIGSNYPLSAIMIADTAMNYIRTIYLTQEAENIIPNTIRAKMFPQNQRIVYRAQEEGRTPSVWKLEPGVNRAERFILKAEEPEFSPDGNMIVFSDQHFGDGKLWLINWDGTGLRQLTR